MHPIIRSQANLQCLAGNFTFYTANIANMLFVFLVCHMTSASNSLLNFTAERNRIRCWFVRFE